MVQTSLEGLPALCVLEKFSKYKPGYFRTPPPPQSTNMSTIALSKVQTSVTAFHFKIKDSLKTQESIFMVTYYTRHIYSIPYLV